MMHVGPRAADRRAGCDPADRLRFHRREEAHMSTRIILTALALSTATSLALAQASSPSREAVKAETTAASKNRELTPAGGGHPTNKAKHPTHSASSPSRAAVRGEAASATDKYQLGAAAPSPGHAKAPASSPMTREQRKAQTQADVKAGEMTPAGPAIPK
jgi:hypothetical protein